MNKLINKKYCNKWNSWGGCKFLEIKQNEYRDYEWNAYCNKFKVNLKMKKDKIHTVGIIKDCKLKWWEL